MRKKPRENRGRQSTLMKAHFQNTKNAQGKKGPGMTKVMTQVQVTVLRSVHKGRHARALTSQNHHGYPLLLRSSFVLTNVVSRAILDKIRLLQHK